MAPTLHSIAQLFPDHESKIHALFLSNESFREVCIEYILCSSKISELRKLGSRDEAALHGYEELQSELEREIVNMLAAALHAADAGKRGAR